MLLKILVALACLCGWQQTAFAAPVIYACTLFQSTHPDAPLAQADQITVDAEGKTIQFAVSRTLGASNPKVWDLTGAVGTSDGDQIVTYSHEDIFRAAGLWEQRPYALMMGGYGESFVATFTLSGSYPAMTIIWDCPK